MVQLRSSVSGGARHTKKLHTILQWIEEQLVPEISPEGEPALVALDSAAIHRTDKVLGLRSCNTTPSLIPGGFTNLIQALDVSVN